MLAGPLHTTNTLQHPPPPPFGVCSALLLSGVCFALSFRGGGLPGCCPCPPPSFFSTFFSAFLPPPPCLFACVALCCPPPPPLLAMAPLCTTTPPFFWGGGLLPGVLSSPPCLFACVVLCCPSPPRFVLCSALPPSGVCSALFFCLGAPRLLPPPALGGCDLIKKQTNALGGGGSPAFFLLCPFPLPFACVALCYPPPLLALAPLCTLPPPLFFLGGGSPPRVVLLLGAASPLGLSLLCLSRLSCFLPACWRRLWLLLFVGSGPRCLRSWRPPPPLLFLRSLHLGPPPSLSGVGCPGRWPVLTLRCWGDLLQQCRDSSLISCISVRPCLLVAVVKKILVRVLATYCGPSRTCGRLPLLLLRNDPCLQVCPVSAASGAQTHNYSSHGGASSR